jgi:hypothetical protein
MTQIILEVLIVGLITGLVGIIWIVVRDCFDDNHDSGVNRLEGTHLPEPCDGEQPQEHSSRQSKTAA